MAEIKKRGESVMGGSKKPKKKKSKKKPVHEMRIRHAANGGYIAKHSFKSRPGQAPEEDEEHAIPDVNSLQEHVGDHMATPPPAAPVPSPSGAGGPGNMMDMQ
jgi:hypothetical protein